MNRRRTLIALPSLVGAALVPAFRLTAQDRTTADVVAARIEAFYRQTRTVEARFEQHFWSRLYQRTQSSRGRLSISRPGKIRFDYDQPHGKVLVSNGSEWTMYEPFEGGPGQYARGPAAAASTGALGFLTGSTNLGSYRRTLRAAAGGQPEHTDALELRNRPGRDDPHVARIVTYVDNRPEALGVVRRVSIEDHDGNWNRFDFEELRFNRELSAETFDYRPPAGARELRAPG